MGPPILQPLPMVRPACRPLPTLPRCTAPLLLAGALLSTSCIDHDGESTTPLEGVVLSAGAQPPSAGQTLALTVSPGTVDDYDWSVAGFGATLLSAGIVVLGGPGEVEIVAQDKLDAERRAVLTLDVPQPAFTALTRAEFSGAPGRELWSARLASNGEELAVGHALEYEFSAVGHQRAGSEAVFANVLPEPDPLAGQDVVLLHAVALDASGADVYAVTERIGAAAEIRRFRRDAGTDELALDPSFLPPSGEFGTGLALGPDADGLERLWVVRNGTPQVLEVRSTTGALVASYDLPALDPVRDVVVGAPGRVLVAERDGGYELEVSGGALVSVRDYTPSLAGGEVMALARDALGRVYLGVEDVTGPTPLGSVRVFNSLGAEVLELDGAALGLVDGSGQPRALERPLGIAATGNGTLHVYEALADTSSGPFARWLALELEPPLSTATVTLDRSSALVNVGWSVDLLATVSDGSEVEWSTTGGLVLARDGNRGRYIASGALGTWTVTATAVQSGATATAFVTTTAANFGFNTPIAGPGGDSHPIRAMAVGGGPYYFVAYGNVENQEYFVQRRLFSETPSCDEPLACAGDADCFENAFVNLDVDTLVNVAADDSGRAYWIDDDNPGVDPPSLFVWPAGAPSNEVREFELGNPVPGQGPIRFRGGIAAAPAPGPGLFNARLFVAVDTGCGPDCAAVVCYDVPADTTGWVPVQSAAQAFPLDTDAQFSQTFALAADLDGSLLVTSSAPASPEQALERYVLEAGAYERDAEFSTRVAAQPIAGAAPITAIAAATHGLVYATTVDEAGSIPKATLWLLDHVGNVLETYSEYQQTTCEAELPAPGGHLGRILGLAASDDGSVRLVDDVLYNGLPNVEAVLGVVIDPN